ncbi:hypothetical protein [Emcibacter nanhaiensis]|uniref:Uncharacterized protein n=1 Tax=Emcibacter nanhaiensis TaxID=1505037 RepID=A0A501PS78_9PROT|nr:hypothetical protein [Emcibacter nanhaiensis]TPD62998.1 hypothetical protein FIV46_02655 [Emcibacter nanhaiensis]
MLPGIDLAGGFTGGGASGGYAKGGVSGNVTYSAPDTSFFSKGGNNTALVVGIIVTGALAGLWLIKK